MLFQIIKALYGSVKEIFKGYACHFHLANLSCNSKGFTDEGDMCRGSTFVDGLELTFFES